ncbi:MAG: helix-turn-helix transcriptional regulator [Candidatus Hydrogenedentes bacterium]|nr:helix-turn-helix transcriptional regulator [Candidatus Hydrogenedentota bacterium]
MKNSFENDMTEMLLLHAAGQGDAGGYDLSQQVLERSRGHFDLLEGDLYPMLHRLERQGLLDSYWSEIAKDRRRKFYRITAQGQMLLESRREQWRQFSTGVNGVLGAPQSTGLLGRFALILSILSISSTLSIPSIRRGESTFSTGA